MKRIALFVVILAASFAQAQSIAKMSVNGISLGMSRSEVESVLRSQDGLNVESRTTRGLWAKLDCTPSGKLIICNSEYSRHGSYGTNHHVRDLDVSFSVATRKLVAIGYLDASPSATNDADSFGRAVNEARRKVGKEAFLLDGSGSDTELPRGAVAVWIGLERYVLPKGETGVASDGTTTVGTDARFAYKLERDSSGGVKITLQDRRAL
jgi:hypothetical protein